MTIGVESCCLNFIGVECYCHYSRYKKGGFFFFLIVCLKNRKRCCLTIDRWLWPKFFSFNTWRNKINHINYFIPVLFRLIMIKIRFGGIAWLKLLWSNLMKVYVSRFKILKFGKHFWNTTAQCQYYRRVAGSFTFDSRIGTYVIYVLMLSMQ